MYSGRSPSILNGNEHGRSSRLVSIDGSEAVGLSEHASQKNLIIQESDEFRDETLPVVPQKYKQ